jgi:hypothetical protein
MNKKRKAYWIGYSWRGNCFLKHVIDGMVDGRMEVTGRRGRRREQVLHEIKKNRGHLKLEKEAIDRTVWRTRLEMSESLS